MPDSDTTAPDPWRRRLRTTLALLAVWFTVTFGVSYVARALTTPVGGWPVSFWIAAQGALLVYVAIVIVYARRMEAIDDTPADAPRD